jgi:hypothetical protein
MGLFMHVVGGGGAEWMKMGGGEEGRVLIPLCLFLAAAPPARTGRASLSEKKNSLCVLNSKTAYLGTSIERHSRYQFPVLTHDHQSNKQQQLTVGAVVQ